MVRHLREVGDSVPNTGAALWLQETCHTHTLTDQAHSPDPCQALQCSDILCLRVPEVQPLHAHVMRPAPLPLPWRDAPLQRGQQTHSLSHDELNTN